METYNIKKRIEREKLNQKWTEDEINNIINYLENILMCFI